MKSELTLDLERLKSRAYHIAEWAEEVLRRYHSAIPNLQDEAAMQLRVLYDWMFVPPTLWPFNIQDVLGDCLSAVEKGKRLNASSLSGLMLCCGDAGDFRASARVNAAWDGLVLASVSGGLAGSAGW